MIDLKNFSEKEANGNAVLVRITEDDFAVSYKKYDPDTGEQLADEVIGGNTKELLDRKEELEKEIAEINGFLKKFSLLESQNE